MKHARKDYDRIQDPAGKIPENEPVFLIRGQDAAGPATLRFWADEAELQGSSKEITNMVREHANKMEDWQLFNTCKAADLPKGTQFKLEFPKDEFDPERDRIG